MTFDFQKAKYIGFSVLLLIGSISLMRTTFEIMKSNKRLEDLRLEVALLEEDKLALVSELKFQKSDVYIEREARDKLNLVKPGENIYVLSTAFEDDLQKDLFKENVLSMDSEDNEKSNFKLWLDLIL